MEVIMYSIALACVFIGSVSAAAQALNGIKALLEGRRRCWEAEGGCMSSLPYVFFHGSMAKYVFFSCMANSSA
jgi:hypothetical protein